jgi:hypothetical protein
MEFVVCLFCLYETPATQVSIWHSRGVFELTPVANIASAYMHEYSCCCCCCELLMNGSLSKDINYECHDYETQAV